VKLLGRFIRWLSLAALIVLVLPILHKFALENHIYNNPGEKISTLLGYVRTISEIPHYQYVLAFVAGLTLGAWTDAILAGAEGRKSEKFNGLADRAFQVRESIH